MGPDSLRQRVLSSAQRTPSPPRAAWRWIAVRRLSLAFAITAASFWLLGGVRLGGVTAHHYVARSPTLVISTAAGAAAIACAVAWFSVRRGRSMLGPSLGWLVGAVLMTPIVLLAWKVALSAAVPEMMIPWPERLGLKCLSLSILFCLPPLSALAWLRRRSQPVHPGWSGAVLGVSVGAMSWVLVDLWCPVAYIPHLLLGHFAPQLVLAVVGAAIGRRVLAPRGA